MSERRNYLFDNYKVFLIYLVVLGHFVTPGFSDDAFLKGVKWFIFAFHMPAFIFASGYFSKRKKPVTDLIGKLLVPYVVFEILYYLLYTYVIHKDTEIALLYPKFTLWFLLAIFIFRIVTPYVMKLPFPMAMTLALAAGFIGGFLTHKGSFLSYSRCLYFFPYFLLGVYMQNEHVEKLRTPRIRKIALGIIAVFLLFLIFDSWHTHMPLSMTYGRYSYVSLGQSPAFGLAMKGFCYLMGFSLTLSFLSVMPEKKTAVSWMGPRTLSVYIFHGLLFKYLEGTTSFLTEIDTPAEYLLLLAGCAAVTWLFSLAPFSRITDFISSFTGTMIKKIRTSGSTAD